MKIPYGLARVEGTTFLRAKHEDLREELGGGAIGIMRRSGDVDIVIMDIEMWVALTRDRQNDRM